MEGESVQEHRHYITEKICYMYFGSTHTVIYRPTHTYVSQTFVSSQCVGWGGTYTYFRETHVLQIMYGLHNHQAPAYNTCS